MSVSRLVQIELIQSLKWSDGSYERVYPSSRVCWLTENKSEGGWERKTAYLLTTHVDLCMPLLGLLQQGHTSEMTGLCAMLLSFAPQHCHKLRHIHAWYVRDSHSQVKSRRALCTKGSLREREASEDLPFLVLALKANAWKEREKGPNQFFFCTR